MDALKLLKNLRLLGKINPYDVINKLQPLIMDLDDFKLDILSSIKKIPPKIDAFELLKVLGEMEIKDSPKDEEDALHIIFKGGTDPVIMDIIQKAIYNIDNQNDINTNNLLCCDIIDPEGCIYDNGIICPLEKIPEKIQGLLKDYPGCYLRINDDLDLRRKKDFDDSCLPYIIVAGNFYSFKKAKKFPILVCETFYCQGLDKKIITKDTLLSITETMDISYSISDFSILTDILLPKCLKKLIVEPRFLKEDYIKNNLKLINEFTKKYPKITILDTKGNNLSDVLKRIKNNTTKELPQKQPEIIKFVTPTIETKIQGQHLEVKEILVCLREKFKEYNIYSDEKLDRLIRSVLSVQRPNGIQKKTLQRPDGVKVICIDASQIDLVHQDLQNIINKEPQEKTSEEIEPVKPKEILKTQSIKREPIKITKYITSKILKQIKKTSPQNVNIVLQTINEINLDPLEMQFQGPVHIIKDGKETVSATVKKESGCCLVQSIDSSNHDDTKRLVWNVADGQNGLIIVCNGFREHHNTKKASNLYEYLRSTAYKKQTYTQQELDAKGYIDIETLINKDFSNTDNSDGDITIPQQPSDILTQQMLNMSHPSY